VSTVGTTELHGIRASLLAMTQRRRLVAGATVGAIAAAVIARFAPWQMAVLGGWDIAAIVFVSSIWVIIPALDGEGTRSTAIREDASRASDDFVVLLASVVSLVGVILTLVEAKEDTGALKAWMTSLAVATVAVSWFTVHTVFTLRYARLYYDEAEGGIDFNQDARPDYLDFVYFSFTVGMTFQVSDTNISSTVIRRAVTRQALLGYLFGTVIIGVTINVVGGLIQ
jgi:uncharacterized membrane protein